MDMIVSNRSGAILPGIESKPIFGRKRDLTYLLERVRKPGITVIAARPQQGKTRLLEALVETLRALPANRGDESFLVGYYAGRGEVPDLLLRSLRDLYENWIGDSNWFQQARVVAQQQGGKWAQWLGGAGQTLANLFKAADPTETVSDGVKNFFAQLLQANEDLKSGGLSLPRLSYEQAQAVVQLVHDVTKARSVLILDAFEQLQDPIVQGNNLKHYLERMDQWPPIHYILACRAPAQGENEDAAYRQGQELEALSAAVKIFSLGPMDLGELSECDAAITYIHECVPITESIPREKLIKALDGYPGTLNRWREGRPDTVEELNKLTRDATKLLYRELEPIFEQLYKHNETLFDIASRAVLLPETRFSGERSPYDRFAIGRGPPDGFDRLVDCGLLQRMSDGACSFGLTARYELAQSIWLSRPTWQFRRASLASDLIEDLADAARDRRPEVILFLFALLFLSGPAFRQRIGSGLRAFLQLFRIALSKQKWSDPDAPSPQEIGIVLRQHRKLAPLAAMMLINALNHAKEENDLARRDALLLELRDVSKDYPNEPYIRDALAQSLYNAMFDAKGEKDLVRRDALLSELRELSTAHSDERAVREQLAKSLVSAQNHAKEENDLARRDALLLELRDLSTAHPDDPAVRKHLADGLFNVLTDAKEENDLPRCNALLSELRELSAAHPYEPAVHENLADGLFSMLIDAKEENGLAHRDALLSELRELSADHPDQPAFREQLAKGLFNTLVDMKRENTLSRRNALLLELRELSTAYPDEPTVREALAKGLVTTLIDAKEENDLVRRDALLSELRELSTAHPDEPSICEELTEGLVNTLIDAKEKNDLARRDALLSELRDLSTAHPNEPGVRTWLAKGLVSTMIDAKVENNQLHRDALLVELRELSMAHPKESSVRAWLARGLVCAMIDAKDEDDLAHRDTLLVELRDLSTAHPDEPPVREWLANSLLNMLEYTKDESDLARRDALLAELRELSTAHPDEPVVRERLAGGLLNALNDVTVENDPVRHDALLSELRELSTAHPEEPVFAQIAATGLFESE